MPIQLQSVDRDHKGEIWTLELEDTVTLKDASGQIVASFPPDDALQRFQLPSFSQSIKYFGVLVEDRTHQFSVSPAILKKIKKFLDRATVAAGPQAVTGIRNKAIRETLIGIGCSLLGFILSIGSLISAASKPQGGRYTITYGLVIFGLVMLGRGLYNFSRYSTLLRLSKKPN